MKDSELRKYWNENAEAWTTISRAGFDIYRDYLNTPSFFAILPDIYGLIGLDIGCGDGHNTRLLAQKAKMVIAIDIAENFILRAKEMEVQNISNIEYKVSSATELPFENEYFDFATSFMCFMDLADIDKAFEEAYRVLKPNGFLQFSITHPCYATPYRKNKRNILTNQTYAIEVGGYFKSPDVRIDEWIFGAAPQKLKNKFPKFKIPVFNRTLTNWFNAILKSGFIVEEINEPCPNDDVVSNQPSLQDAKVVPYFLHIRCRKTIQKR